jgi:hypothetical protein
VPAIAGRLGCHPKKVRRWLHRFNADGAGGHRVKAPPGVFPRAGQDLGLRRAARRRRADGHPVRPVPQQQPLPAVPAAGGGRQPAGRIVAVTGNLSSHDSKATRAWPEDHPRIRHAFIPEGACRLNPQEGRRRIFRRQALAGQAFAGPGEITRATRVATAQPSARARPWGRPQPRHRSCRRRFVYSL